MTTVLNNAKQKIILTQDGYNALLAEYKQLTEVQRPEIVAQITHARELGDLSENGMYHAAREKQSFLEGRIREIEDILKRIEVAEAPLQTSGKRTVQLGSKVVLEMNDQTVEYHIVGAEEVNFAHGRISLESPLGQALIGKLEGDTVVYQAPMGQVTYRVKEIK